MIGKNIIVEHVRSLYDGVPGRFLLYGCKTLVSLSHPRSRQIKSTSNSDSWNLRIGIIKNENVRKICDTKKLLERCMKP